MENGGLLSEGRVALVAAALMLAACQGREAAPAQPAANEAQAAPAAAAPAAAPGPTSAPAPASPAPPAPAPAPSAAPPSPWSPTGYRLIGTAPFWGGTVAGEAIVYSTPENQEGERVAVSASYGSAREIYFGVLDGQPFTLTLTRGPCSDGMADNVHTFSAVVKVRGESRNGCANPRPR